MVLTAAEEVSFSLIHLKVFNVISHEEEREKYRKQTFSPESQPTLVRSQAKLAQLTCVALGNFTVATS